MFMGIKQLKSDQSRFGQVWSALVRFGQVWSGLVSGWREGSVKVQTIWSHNDCGHRDWRWN